MAYIRRTVDEFEIQQDSGFGYEMVTVELTYEEAKKRRNEYAYNQPEHSVIIVKKRIKL